MVRQLKPKSSTIRTPWHWRTSDADGLPNVRMVLLKGVDHGGFVFDTNEESWRGRAWWPTCRPPSSCIGSRCGGRWCGCRPVERVTDAEADAYFNSRALQSRIGYRRASSRARSKADLRWKRPSPRSRRSIRSAMCHARPIGTLSAEADLFRVLEGRAFRLHDRIAFIARRRTGRGT